MKNTYFPTAVGLYLNYLVHGMGVLLMTLNMSHLEQQWQTNAAGVSVVISSLGFGRLIVLFISGMLSDKFGRKPFIYLGMLCYLGFFFGIISSQSITTAFAFGFLAGMANSFLDSGTYPALMESFPNSASTANILIKAFVSAGQFLLPFIISAVVLADIWFGWSFIIAAAIMVLNALYLIKRPFPDHRALAKTVNTPVQQVSKPHEEHKSSLLDIACFTLYGYISMATFYLVSQWLAQYGQFVAGMPYASAIKLLSIYTVGSLTCVFVTAALVKKAVSSVTLLMLYTFISLAALLSVCLHPTPMAVMVFAFVIGFSAAGGVMQLGLTIMAMSFPNAKGKATGIFYSAGSLATFTIPLITAKLSQTSIASIMWFDVGIAAAGFALALFIGYRQLSASHYAAKVNRVQA
ncbi:MFS transporter [Pantoea sp. B65]|uniref:MFS transporter n=1 Tax=Pantoea sp. B65 TaxID=2813359 RepID=UPI0039B56CB2